MGSLVSELQRREAAARAEAEELRGRIAELAERLAGVEALPRHSPSRVHAQCLSPHYNQPHPSEIPSHNGIGSTPELSRFACVARYRRSGVLVDSRAACA